MNRTRRLLSVAVALGLGIGTMAITGAPAQADKPQCARTNNTVPKLLECVTLEGALEHEEAFQAIADANGGIRALGTPGYEASVDYVVEKLRKAGYTVTTQEFNAYAWSVVGPSTLQQTAPTPTTYVENTDYAPTTQSPPGDVTAAVTPVDLQLGLGNASTSGCEATDFAGFPAGNIALLQRGGCTFEIKAENAAAAGAVGVIFFNQGNTAAPDRNGIPNVTLSNFYEGGIPAVGTTYALGAQLSTVAGLTMRMFVNVSRAATVSRNVIADSRYGSRDNIVMAGAHLDSVDDGPGINDNGSGSAGLLEVAEAMGKTRQRNAFRFAWWGAEEAGLVGSTAYVNDLVNNDPDALDDIALYLNFDMIGSPNYGLFVYDGDGDAFGLVGPDGSDDIEGLFEQYYAEREIPSRPTAFSGRSDYQAFINNGIPSGGLFTGAEGIKTAEEAELWGGEAGVAYDPCYHAACDTIDNVNHEALDVNADAIGYAVLTYVQSTFVINGVPGKGDRSTPPAQIVPNMVEGRSTA